MMKDVFPSVNCINIYLDNKVIWSVINATRKNTRVKIYRVTGFFYLELWQICGSGNTETGCMCGRVYLVNSWSIHNSKV